ncbi:methionyl-tRNA formyltransferase [Alkalibacter mobilis]|uniref:methionyl-tRNA formyltransferase n=1 Tax=Alkalibacter mobilis TaxID=2787712 RepID=UPI00189EEF6A|nr:methionyl-tRNA formyltransferase [Alkalibacter mobilis]MBF7095858.1 methionyl-tRNA formyltransferase [Alkalibacter mobilis]
MKVIFMGTPEFSVDSLKALVESDYEICAVVTQPDKPNQRGKRVKYNPVKEAALKFGLKVLQPQNIKDPKIVAELKSMEPDFLAVVAYGQLLSKEILDIPKKGSINVHASLLPEYRGAAPIHWAVIDGREKSGVTTMLMDEDMDTGDMLLRKTVEISGDMTTSELHDELAKLGAALLVDTLNQIASNRLVPEKQNHDAATYTQKINRETGKIQWEKSAKEIHDLIRGTYSYPGAFSYLNGERVKLSASQILEKEDKPEFEKAKPGTILGIDKRGMSIRTGTGLLLIKEIQFPGKKVMSVEEYSRGHKDLTGAVFATLS